MSDDDRQQDESQFQPAIRRASIKTLTIYEISESELETLERGSPDSIDLNFSIFFLSSAVTLLLALFTTPPDSTRAFTVFTVLCTVGFVAGVYLLVRWYRNHRSISTVVTAIRLREPPVGESEFE